MTPQQYLDHVAADSASFASSTAGSLDEPIAHLGDWTVRDLVAHLGAVYSMVISLTRHLAGDKAAGDQASLGDPSVAPDGAGIIEWFAERRTTLLATLAEAPDDAEAQTFTGVQTVQWWKRRMASETAVHRWDADAARAGAASPIDAELATDAIDEYIEVSLRHSSSRPDRIYPASSLHLHRNDGPGEWMLVGDGHGGLTVTHEHGKGDAAVRGTASQLLLWIWGRSTEGIEMFGDEDVADAWRSLAP